MLYPEMSIKEGVAKETLIGLASIRYMVAVTCCIEVPH